jgi:hypothetical protein
MNHVEVRIPKQKVGAPLPDEPVDGHVRMCRLDRGNDWKRMCDVADTARLDDQQAVDLLGL